MTLSTCTLCSVLVSFGPRLLDLDFCITIIFYYFFDDIAKKVIPKERAQNQRKSYINEKNVALYNYHGPLAPGLNFVKNSLTYFLFSISSSALHLIAERLASITTDTSFKVFGFTRLRVELSLPTSKANALNH